MASTSPVRPALPLYVGIQTCGGGWGSCVACGAAAAPQPAVAMAIATSDAVPRRILSRPIIVPSAAEGLFQLRDRVR